MITHPVASGVCRRAATRIRELAEAAYPGPWISDDSDNCWRLHSSPDPRFPTMQILKAPKRNTPYAEYWPDEATAGHIVAWSPPPALAVADWLDQAATELDALSRDEPLPPMLGLACRTAEAFWMAQPHGEPDSLKGIEARLTELKAKRAAVDPS